MLKITYSAETLHLKADKHLVAITYVVSSVAPPASQKERLRREHQSRADPVARLWTLASDPAVFISHLYSSVPRVVAAPVSLYVLVLETIPRANCTGLARYDASLPA